MKLYASTVDPKLLEILVDAVNTMMPELSYYVALDAVASKFQDYLVEQYKETNDTYYLAEIVKVFDHLNYMSNNNLESMIGYPH